MLNCPRYDSIHLCLVCRSLGLDILPIMVSTAKVIAEAAGLVGVGEGSGSGSGLVEFRQGDAAAIGTTTTSSGGGMSRPSSPLMIPGGGAPSPSSFRAANSISPAGGFSANPSSNGVGGSGSGGLDPRLLSSARIVYLSSAYWDEHCRRTVYSRLLTSLPDGALIIDHCPPISPPGLNGGGKELVIPLVEALPAPSPYDAIPLPNGGVKAGGGGGLGSPSSATQAPASPTTTAGAAAAGGLKIGAPSSAAGCSTGGPGSPVALAPSSGVLLYRSRSSFAEGSGNNVYRSSLGSFSELDGGSAAAAADGAIPATVGRPGSALDAVIASAAAAAAAAAAGSAAGEAVGTPRLTESNNSNSNSTAQGPSNGTLSRGLTLALAPVAPFPPGTGSLGPILNGSRSTLPGVRAVVADIASSLAASTASAAATLARIQAQRAGSPYNALALQNAVNGGQPLQLTDGVSSASAGSRARSGSQSAYLGAALTPRSSPLALTQQTQSQSQTQALVAVPRIRRRTEYRSFQPVSVLLRPGAMDGDDVSDGAQAGSEQQQQQQQPGSAAAAVPSTPRTARSVGREPHTAVGGAAALPSSSSPSQGQQPHVVDPEAAELAEYERTGVPSRLYVTRVCVRTTVVEQ